MVVGSPARSCAALTDDEIKWKSSGTGQYQELAVRSHAHHARGRGADEVEADRKRMIESALPLHLHKNASP